MFWLIFTILTFFVLIASRAIISQNDMTIGDIVGFTLLGTIAGLIITGVISLFLMHNATSVYTYEKHYDLVPIAEGVYGYEKKDNEYKCVCYAEENGRLIELEFNTNSSSTDVIYTDDYTPSYYECRKDYESEALRKLFWKCGCENITSITLPFGSITEEPD